MRPEGTLTKITEEELRALRTKDGKLKNVDHPPHYNSHPSGVECITITEHMSFCIGNAMKYLWRAKHKNGVEDLEKAIWYIRREIERLHLTSGGLS